MVYYTPNIQSESTLIKTYLILFQLQTVKQRANKTECCLQTYFYMHDVCLKFLKSNKKIYKKTTYKTPGRAHACRVARDILVCAYLLFDAIYCCKSTPARHGQKIAEIC